MAKQTSAPIAPVAAKVVVPGAPERAFGVFTEHFGEWWPLETQSVFRKDAASCRFEAKVGGRIVETGKDGRESVWGTVLEVEAPDRVKFSWHPGRAETTAQTITVRLTPLMMFGTTVELEHAGWDKFGDGATEMRADYQRKWPGVLAKLVALGTKK